MTPLLFPIDLGNGLTMAHITGPFLQQVALIECESFDSPYNARQISRWLNEPGIVGKMIVRGEEVLGFIVYALEPRSFYVRDIAVRIEHRRQGIGRALLKSLIDRLRRPGRRRIVLEVSEDNLDAQLFYRALGFRAEAVLENWYCNGSGAYGMVYRLPRPAAEKKEAEKCLSNREV